MTGLSPKASAFCVQATAKSPSPAASNRSTGLRSRSMMEGRQKVTIPASSETASQIAPIADRRGAAGGTAPISRSRVMD
jgi:hypothetical protein